VSRRLDATKARTGRNGRHHARDGDVPADRGIRDIANLERHAVQARSRLDQTAAFITRVAASGAALVLHVVWFGSWIIVNSKMSPITPFDPFPYSLLTTIVSLEAIFLTLFVLIAQNRMSLEADRRAELDLQINILAEKESTMVLRILQDISSHVGVQTKATKDLKELLKETRVDELARKLEKALPNN